MERKKEEYEYSLLKGKHQDNEQLNNDMWNKQFNLELDYKHMRRMQDEEDAEKMEKLRQIWFEIKDLTAELKVQRAKLAQTQARWNEYLPKVKNEKLNEQYNRQLKEEMYERKRKELADAKQFYKVKNTQVAEFFDKEIEKDKNKKKRKNKSKGSRGASKNKVKVAQVNKSTVVVEPEKSNKSVSTPAKSMAWLWQPEMNLVMQDMGNPDCLNAEGIDPRDHQAKMPRSVSMVAGLNSKETTHF